MNNRDIIESGILESYLLGLGKDHEQEQTKQIVLADHTLREYIEVLENNIREYFDQKSVNPPSQLREVLQLRTLKSETRKEKHVFGKAADSQNRQSGVYHDIEVNDTHIKVHKYWRPAFITVFILSKIFLIAGLYYFFKSASLENENAKLRTQSEQVR
ncbi:hypothetical protein [Dyadobacter bucti]|uniref:hypothetical protein n=1 Tax=Dyadobacter bucti TaxID=2572203 RepID=UPI001108A56E|nr:hypothetical protein [Dyadobacter bucti]